MVSYHKLSKLILNSHFRPNKINFLVLSFITSLDLPLITNVSNAPTSQATWTTLANLYANKSWFRVIVLKERLQLNSKGIQTVFAYLQSIKEIASESAIINHLISNEDLTLYILNGLGPEFKEFIISLCIGDHPLSFEELYDKLIAHKEYLK